MNRIFSIQYQHNYLCTGLCVELWFPALTAFSASSAYQSIWNVWKTSRKCFSCLSRHLSKCILCGNIWMFELTLTNKIFLFCNFLRRSRQSCPHCKYVSQHHDLGVSQQRWYFIHTLLYYFIVFCRKELTAKKKSGKVWQASKTQTDQEIHCPSHLAD